MSTAGHPDALARRIEQLAAASHDEGEGEGNAVAALVGALRAEIGAVRAEVGSLRSETGAVRSNVDGIASEVHRSLAAATEREQRSTASAGAGLEDARGMLEARMAVLEDVLDALSERIEALARDGASTTTGLLRVLEASVRGLDQRIADEARDAAELLVGRLREVTETRLSELETTLWDRFSGGLVARHDDLRRDVLGALEQTRAQATEDRQAVQELVGTVRTALDGVTALLDRSLSGLGSTVTTALGESRDETSVELGGVADRMGASLAALRAELAGRDDVAAGRLTGVQSAVEGTLEQVRVQLSTALTVLRSDVATEIGTLTPRVDELAVAGTATSESLRSLRNDVVDTVADLRDRLLASSTDSIEVLRGAMTETRSEIAEITRALREDLLDRIEEKSSGVADRLLALTDDVTAGAATKRGAAERVAALTVASEEVRRTLDQVRDGVTTATDELAITLRARADEQASATAERLALLDAHVREQLTGLHAWLGDRVGSLESGLGERVAGLQGSLAERVGAFESALTALDASVGDRLAALSHLAERQREEVEELLEKVRDDVIDAGRDLRKELLTKTSEQLAELGERVSKLDAIVDESTADVVDRLTAFATTLATSTEVTGLVIAGLGEVTSTAGGLEETLAGFRSEWPTRTYEVVQGAKAVAEGVVSEVRAQVGAQLEEVRDELANAVDSVDEARSGLEGGTDRLALAGAVLVAYLEERDRLLEGERDRVVHEVLDQFAAGLSARDRAALAGRVTDAVTRRRDARDAERYRSAVGQPVPPKVDLPDEVLDLAPPDAAQARVAARPPISSSGPAAGGRPPASAADDDDRGHDDEPDDDGYDEDRGGRPAPGRARPATGTVVAPKPLPRSRARKPGDPVEGTAVKAKPSPGRRAGSPAAAKANKATPAKATAAAAQTKAAQTKAAPTAPVPSPDGARSLDPSSTGRLGVASGKGTAREIVEAAGPTPDGAAAPRSGSASAAPGDAPAGSPRPAERRGRLDAMPEVPSVDVALNAAAPDEGGTGRSARPQGGEASPGAGAAAPAGDRPPAPSSASSSAPSPTARPAGPSATATSALAPAPSPAPTPRALPPEDDRAGRPPAPLDPPVEGDEGDEDDDGVRRLFRRRPRP